MRYLLIVIILSTLVGCAKSVSSLKIDQDKILSNETGYLLIGVETNIDLKGVHISGPTSILLSPKDLRKGSNFILVDLSAGTYVIEQVLLNKRWRVEMKDDSNWNVEILPGKVNYIGHINISTRWGGWLYSYLNLVNKSSYAIEFMEDSFSNILSNREMHYGGPGDDTFFNHINNKVKSL